MQSNGTSRPGPDAAIATLLVVVGHLPVKPRFVPCPACSNAKVEDFAQDADADGIVTCLKCNEEVDPEGLQ